MKQEAVAKARTWYQSHCNLCDRDVGGFVPNEAQAQEFATRHNEHDLDHQRRLMEALGARDDH